MTYYDPRRPKPWYIKLLARLGVTNEAHALMIVLTTSVLLLGLTVWIYSNTFSATQVEEVDPVHLNSMRPMN